MKSLLKIHLFWLIGALLLLNPLSHIEAQSVNLLVEPNAIDSTLEVYLISDQTYNSTTEWSVTFTIKWAASANYDLGTWTPQQSGAWQFIANANKQGGEVSYGGLEYQSFGFVDGDINSSNGVTLTANVPQLIGEIDITGASQAGLDICSFKYSDDYFTGTASAQDRDFYVEISGIEVTGVNDPRQSVTSTFEDGLGWNKCDLVNLEPQDTAIINSGQITLDSSIAIKQLEIRPSVIFEITTGNTFTADTISLEANDTAFAQLTGDGSVNNPVTAQAYLDCDPARWFALGSPFADASFNDFNNGELLTVSSGSQGNVFQWDASNGTWAAPSSASATVVNGRGYSFFAGSVNDQFGTRNYLLNGPGVLNVQGTVDFSDQSIALAYDDGQSGGVSFVGGSDVADTEGWNYLANPYTAIYNWDGQSLPSGLNNAIYWWNPVSSSYSTYVSGVGNNGGSQYLPPFQAFWVQTKSTTPGSLTFAAAQRAPADTMYGPTYKTNPLDGLKLKVTDDQQHTDELYIGYDANATVGYDAMLDARKLQNGVGVPNLYTQIMSDRFSVCRVPYNSMTSFDIHLTDTDHGEKMTIEADLSGLQAYQIAELEDRKLNQRHDLHSGDYSFEHDSLWSHPRFVLHLSNPGMNQDEHTPEQNTGAYAYTTTDGIELMLPESEGEADVVLYSLSGQQLAEHKGVKGRVAFNLEEAQAIYLLHISSARGSYNLKVVK